MELHPRAFWKPDCQGKQDFDGPLLWVSSRYYPGPDGGGSMMVTKNHIGAKIETIPYGTQPSAVSAIHLRLGPVQNGGGGGDYYVWRSKDDFTAPTEAEVKAQVEAWVTEQMAEIVKLMGGMAQFKQP